MRQLQNLPSTPGYRNASTCGFSARKERHARGFWNLPHTSDRRFRKRGEKTEICRPDPGFTLPRPAVLLAKIELCSEVFDFSPHFRKTRQRRASRSENRYEFRGKNSLLNAKTAYQRFPRTKPDVPSQGPITVAPSRKNPISVNPLPANRSELRLGNNTSVKLHASRKTYTISSFPN